MPAKQGPTRTESALTKKRHWGRWRLAAAVLLISGILSAFQFAGWVSAHRDTEQKRAALETSRAELSRVQAEHQAAELAARKELDTATAA